MTTATKVIEAKIAGDVWDRQKRWEMKREILFQATRNLAEADDALLACDSVLQVMAKEATDKMDAWIGPRHARALRWTQASKALDETRLLVDIVCGPEAKRALDDFAMLTGKIAAGVNKQDITIYRKSGADLAAKLLAVKVAIRTELELDTRS